MEPSADNSLKSTSSEYDTHECADYVDALLKERDFLADELQRTKKELRYYKDQFYKLQEKLHCQSRPFHLSGERASLADDSSLRQTKAFIESVLSNKRKQSQENLHVDDDSYLYSSYDSSNSEVGTADLNTSPNASSNSKDKSTRPLPQPEHSGIGLFQSRETVLGLRAPPNLRDDQLDVAYDTIAVLLNTIHALQPTAQQIERITGAFMRRGIMPIFLDSSKTSFSLNLECQGMSPVHIAPRFVEGTFIPEQAYCLMAQFMARYLIPKEEAKELLIALCALMKRVDDEACALATSRLRAEIIALRRRLSMGIPYEKVLSDNQIYRLKQDLNRFRMLYMREVDRKARKVNIHFRTSTDESLLHAMNSELQQLSSTISNSLRGTTGAVLSSTTPEEKNRASAHNTNSPHRSVKVVRVEQPHLAITPVEVARTMTHEFEILVKRVRSLLDRSIREAQHCCDLPSLHHKLVELATQIEDLLIDWSASSRQVLSAILQLTYDTFTHS
ncbi:hypothetical protein GL50803_008446 [Giardia duodenalis]|uniref:Uncharacterized protein n=1 Tax=Giardia intestinalis (strain ATCC 50803 / WB clone C6) TaxID=184922 RepID=A8BXP8_GIAIC|nr:hypothetical protein GL50803_008446 [Giardia intestinalis]KAE8304626.1 hypothetical protein GL50803_008446 [Giardia intestinalis]|eukprot:XP_001704267.1 Hypothetical protein GL50803_8446 [Giardia lamblia ATCC 50803]